MSMTDQLQRKRQCDMPPAVLSGIHRGVMRTRYRDRLFLKSPFDIVLYMQLIGRLRPQTVIEIGSREGGSALWFLDTALAHGVNARVISVDLNPPPACDPRVSFIRGDALALEHALPECLLASLPHPWLVSEDSAHTFDTCSAVLHFFDKYLQRGDYLVIEDGVVTFLPEPRYRRFADGPTNAIDAFLETRGRDFEVDASLCDYFGYNVTYNPNSWLRRL